MVSAKYIKLLLIATAIVIVGIVFLNVAGRIFISEVIQEVEVATQEQEPLGARVGARAPHWELPDLQGNTIALSDFLGKPLVITFWTTWNAMAADQITILDEYVSSNTQTLFEIVTINNQEDKSIVSNFIRRGEYQVQVLLDENGQVGELYQVRTLPVTYFLDADGAVKDIFVGVLSEAQLVEKTQAIIR